MSGTSGVLDLRGIDLLRFDLAKQRTKLERRIAPYVTSKRTNIILNFKNKQRYLKPWPPGLFGSIISLQCLYGIEAARKTEDIDKVVRLAIIFGREDECRGLFELTGVHVRDAVFSKVRQREGGQRGAKKANERRAAKRPNYLSAVSELMAMGIKYTPACEIVGERFDVFWQTVRNNTPELRPGKRLRKR